MPNLLGVPQEHCGLLHDLLCKYCNVFPGVATEIGTIAPEAGRCALNPIGAEALNPYVKGYTTIVHKNNY